MYEAFHWLYLNIAERDVNSFVPAWAAYRGIIATPNISLTPEQRKTYLGLTPHLVRLLRNRDVIALEKELMIEQIRRSNFRNSISRLSCIYCWQDEATARLAPRYWSNQGKHFDERYLVEIGVSASKSPTIVDTRWIDKYLNNSMQPLKDLGIEWIKEYWRGARYPWNGETDLPEQPLMECLVDGTAAIYGTALRMEAYSLVERLAPDSIGILEKGRLGVDLCARFNCIDEWRLGQLVPVLLADKKKAALRVSHLILADEVFSASINEKINSGFFKSDEVNFKALEVFKKDTLTLPDLEHINADTSWLLEQPTLNTQLYQILTELFLENGDNIASVVNKRRMA
jgi:hypothetical protein